MNLPENIYKNQFIELLLEEPNSQSIIEAQRNIKLCILLRPNS
jgi:hypothetical protein